MYINDVITDTLFSLPQLLQATEGAKGLLLLLRALFVDLPMWSVCLLCATKQNPARRGPLPSISAKSLLVLIIIALDSPKISTSCHQKC